MNKLEKLFERDKKNKPYFQWLDQYSWLVGYTSACKEIFKAIDKAKKRKKK